MPSVIVVGGGYAGVSAVLTLARALGSTWSVTLVDRRPEHELQTRLPAVLSGRVAVDRAAIPFERILPPRVRFLLASVLGIDPANRLVETDAGSLQADEMVVTLGAAPDFLGIRGAAEQSLVFKSLADTQTLRTRVQSFSRPFRVVVVGAGYTGTEVAGEFAHRPDGPAASVEMVAEATRLLQDGSERVGVIAERLLERAGVRFRLGVTVDRVTANTVHIDSGDEIPADVIVWAARSTGSRILRKAPWRLSADGRLVTDPYLRVAGYPHVWAAGDAAAIYDYRHDHPVASSAQMAVEEGRTVGANIAAIAAGRSAREFRPVNLGEALALGGRSGVADVGGVVVIGRAAIAAKRAALVRYLVQIGGSRLAAEYA